MASVNNIERFRTDRGWSRPQLAQRMGTSPQQIERLEKGHRTLRPEWIDKAAIAFGVSPAEIITAQDVKSMMTTPEPNALVLPMEGGSLERFQENLPVWGAALGAEREFNGDAIELTTLNTGDVVDYVRRPAMLNGKKGVYALHVQGSSMHPALPDGEMLVAARDMPLSVGDNVVVFLRTDDHAFDDGQTSRGVLVKELVRRSASFVELRQYQPAKDFKVDMREVLRIDRVLTRREMLS